MTLFPEDGLVYRISNIGLSLMHLNALQRRNAIASINIGGTNYQSVIYWNKNAKLVIETRQLPGEWTQYTYDGTSGLLDIELVKTDNTHLYATLGIDENGYLHIVTNTHGSVLLYRKSTQPINAFDGGLTDLLPMTGIGEDRIGYVNFYNDPSGKLYAMGIKYPSPRINTLRVYDSTAGTWSGAVGAGADGDLSSGWDYFHHPCFDDNFGAGGYMHLCISRCTNEYDHQYLRYVRWDGTDWTQSDASPQTFPMVEDNCDIVDAGVVPKRGTTAFPAMASDSNGFPLAVYPKATEDYGDRHIYCAYNDGTGWAINQVTETPSPYSNNLGAHAGDGSGTMEHILIVVDKTTNIAYCFYENRYTDHEGILVCISNPGDFSIWRRYLLYPRPIGNARPNLDLAEFERTKRLFMFVSYWEYDQTQLPIGIFEGLPMGELETEFRRYYALNRLSLTDIQWTNLQNATIALGDNTNDNPACRNHTRAITNGVIYEALFEDEDFAVVAMKHRLATVLEVNENLIDWTYSDEVNGTLVTFSYDGTDRISLLILGGMGATYEESLTATHAEI